MTLHHHVLMHVVSILFCICTVIMYAIGPLGNQQMYIEYTAMSYVITEKIFTGQLLLHWSFK